MLRDDFLLNQLRRLVAAVSKRRDAPEKVTLEGELGEMLRSYAQLTPELADRLSSEGLFDLLVGDDRLSAVRLLSVALLIHEMGGARRREKAMMLAERTYAAFPDETETLLDDFPLLTELFDEPEEA